MPSRRSARATGLKSAAIGGETSGPPVKAASNLENSEPSKKRRAPSPAPVSSPLKRSRRPTGKKSEKDPRIRPPRSSRRPTGSIRSSKLSSSSTGEAPTLQQRPYFNPLPSPPETLRPGLQLFVWGAGNFGQFGTGPDDLGEHDRPRRNRWVEQEMKKNTFGAVGAGLEVVAGGGLHTVFIDENGTVWTCGANDNAALGRITEDVPDPENLNIFLDVDNLTCTPHSLTTLLDENFRAVEVAAGDSVCAVVSKDGDLRVWGSFRSKDGISVFSRESKRQFNPTTILSLPHKPGDNEKVSAVAAGANHFLVLTTHGNVLTWGVGENAQLGRVLEHDKIHDIIDVIPQKIRLGTRTRKAVKIGAGSMHSFAIDERGNVWGWGLNTMGQTGTGYDSCNDKVVLLPKQVKRLNQRELGGDTVIQIDGGEHHSLFLTNNGKVYACGRCNVGQLGLSNEDIAFKDLEKPEFIPEPTLVTFPDMEDPIIQVSCGPHNNLAVTRGGALYSWGQGVQGELGVPDVEVRSPRIIVRKEGPWAAVTVSCGGQHTLGLFRKKSS